MSASDTTPGRRARRGHGRPTLHDVAEAAGVTRITVSRFLREPGLLSEETAHRVREAIAQTGYVPNLHAGQLASAQSPIIAALIPNVGQSMFAETIQGLSEALHDTGHELLLASTGYSLEREEAQLRALAGWAPGAIIITGRHHSAGTVRLLERAVAGGTPVIEIWDHGSDRSAGRGFAQIGFDHFEVGRAMARHLLAEGHRHLAYVDSAVAEDLRAQERGDGFAAEAASARVVVARVRAPTGDLFDAGRQALVQLRATRKAPSAAAFANDTLACGALLEALKRQVAVPSDLALLGFGDFPIGRQLSPDLSTIRPPRAEIGRAAAQAALRALSSGRPAEGEMLAWTLVQRGSTRKA